MLRPPVYRLVFRSSVPRCQGRSFLRDRASLAFPRRQQSTSSAVSKSSGQRFGNRHTAFFYGSAIGLLWAGSVFYFHTLHAESPYMSHGIDASDVHNTKVYRYDEVQKHGPGADRKWIVLGTGVYDITDWIGAHPGGDIILRAVGGTIDRYWDIFTIHRKQDVYDILEQYRIGDIDERDLIDGKIPSENIDDPFKTDPQRDERLQVHTKQPCNAETPEDELQSFITPNDTFYVRNHMWVPVETVEQKLTIELPDGAEKTYTLDELKKKFEQVNITATLQCSGNRRRHMTERARHANGLQWGVGAISNAEWTGVRLRDVLSDAGFPVDNWADDAKHAHFVGSEAYSASIPIEKAVDRRGDVLIVFGMNGEPLPHDHGYPMRVIVPGYVAARSVKWIDRIRVSDEESQSQWQQRDYKCFGPNVRQPDWDSAPAIQDTPVQSAITSLKALSRTQLPEGVSSKFQEACNDFVAVEGYSYAGGGRSIVRVDVSPDNGKTWKQAELLADEAKGAKAWSWRLWRFILPRDQAGSGFVVKAVDEANNCQPESYEPQYNPRGNLTTAWHQVSYPKA